MTDSLRDDRYEFIAKVSDNDFTESWQVHDHHTGHTAFLKIPSANSELDQAFICETLRISAQEQAALTLRLTVSRFAITTDSPGCRVFYPWLEHLTRYPEFLISTENVRAILIEIAIITDYLHALGLVHRDLKLSNFVEVRHGGTRYVALTDLDLLAAVNTPCDKKIFGTPGMIAPEVLTNQVFTAQADLYSLGRSLEALRRDHPDLVPEPTWSALAEALTDENPFSRPEFMLEAMHRCGLLTDSELQQAYKRLLAILLFNRFKQYRHRGQGWLRQLIDDQCRVFGLPGELLDDLEAEFPRKPARVLRAFRHLIRQATVSRAGEFWSLRLTDDCLIEVYELIGRSLTDEFHAASTQVALTVIPGVPYLMHDSPLKRLLCLRRILAEPSDVGPAAAAALLEEAGDLAMTLSRSREAAERFEQALSLTEPGRRRLALLRKLMFQFVTLSRLEDAKALIGEALSLARQVADNEALLDVRRQHAWFVAADGRVDEAGELLQAITQEARDQGYDFVLVRSLGAELFRYSKIQRLETTFKLAEEIITLADRIGFPPSSYVSQIALISQHFVLANYRKAEAYAARAERMTIVPHLRYINTWLYLGRTSVLTRLGDFKAARYWLHRIFSDTDSEQADFIFRRYYISISWIQTEQGELPEAEQNALRSLRFDNLETGPEYLGASYQILCNVSMRMGQYKDCEQFGTQAAANYDPVGWPTFAEEIALLRDLNRLHNGDGIDDWNAMIERQDRLFTLGATYYAVILTFHILLYADDTVVRVAIERFERGTAALDDNEFPLLEATHVLVLGRTDDVRKRILFSKALKASVRILENIKELFLSMLLCERIGSLSSTDVGRRRARGYLETALTYAQALANRTAENRLRKAIEVLGTGGDLRQKMLESMLSISQVFSDGTDYESALTRMLHFAVDESGAERGALYLISSQSGQFLLRASVDCDEASLKDIEGISNGLLSRARTDPEPKVIADARSDKDLQKYQSVVANNIRSVATVPMFSDGKLRGLLYMDHHTVPAQFDDADLLYVRTIANFLGVMLDSIDRRRTVSARVEMLDEERRQLGMSPELVAEDPAMLKLLKELPQIACTNASILLRGESGTGKELIVEMIHKQSHRSDKPLVRVNCAAIPDDLMESELFGIRGGTATNARDRTGKFEHADGGTLFLDEIGDMSPAIQGAVLRCLEYQRFERVGSHRTIHTDIRFVYATNKNLEEMVEKGTFRLDLYHRIKTIDLVIPPLRERPNDIIPLVNYFARLYRAGNAQPLRFTEEAVAAVLAHSWPGNVRELRNLVERLTVLQRSDIVQLQDLPDSLRLAVSAHKTARPRLSPEETELRHLAEELGLDIRWLEPDLEIARRPGHLGLSSFEQLEREVIRTILKGSRGNISKTARTLNYSVATLRRRIKKYGLDHSVLSI
jgi:Nif-specific regulatory protein